MRNLLAAGLGLVIALLIAIWCLYLVVAMVIVSGLSFLAWLLSDGWLVLVCAGVAAIVTAVWLVRTGRIYRTSRRPLPVVVPHVTRTQEGSGHVQN